MHTDLGYSARRGKTSTLCFDLTGTLGRFCARREVEAKLDSSDEVVDSTVYRAHEITAYGSSGRERAGEQ
jgi:hypothetical protein